MVYKRIGIKDPQNRDTKGRFIKGNTAKVRGKRLCAAYPFCRVRIGINKRPHRIYCSYKCKAYTSVMLKRLKLSQYKKQKRMHPKLFL